MVHYTHPQLRYNTKQALWQICTQSQLVCAILNTIIQGTSSAPFFPRFVLSQDPVEEGVKIGVSITGLPTRKNRRIITNCRRGRTSIHKGTVPLRITPCGLPRRRQGCGRKTHGRRFERRSEAWKARKKKEKAVNDWCDGCDCAPSVIWFGDGSMGRSRWEEKLCKAATFLHRRWE